MDVNTRTAFLMTLLLAACGGGPVGGDTTPPSDTPPAPILDGSWTLVDGVVDGTPLGPVAGREPSLTIDPDGQRAYGTTGCNTYSATMVIADAGWLLWGDGFAVTEIGCEPAVMDVESRFLAALTRTDRVEMDGDSMTLTNEDGSVVLQMLVKTPDPDLSLGNTHWILSGFAEGSTARSVLAGTAPTLVVDPEAGAIRGNGGCNDFGAQLTLDGARMAVSEMFYTEMACEESVMTQEAGYFDALRAAKGWTIQGPHLTIEASDGRTLTFTGEN